ncbi:MAG: hypothetical protein AB1630_10960 [bacterium]
MAADIYINVIFLKTGEIIAQKNAIDIAGAGFTKEQASINALKKSV